MQDIFSLHQFSFWGIINQYYGEKYRTIFIYASTTPKNMKTLCQECCSLLWPELKTIFISQKLYHQKSAIWGMTPLTHTQKAHDATTKEKKK